MLFPIFAAVSCASLIKPKLFDQPVGEDVIEALNGAIKGLIDGINPSLKEKLTGAGLDPWKEPAHGALTKDFNARLCKGTAGVYYGVSNIVGLSDLHIGDVRIVAANVSDDGTTTTFDINAHIDPLPRVLASVEGHVGITCGRIHPRIGISGKITADQIGLDMAVLATVTSENAGMVVRKVHVEAFSAQFNTVLIDIDGLHGLNEVLDALLPVVENTFKSQILHIVNGLVLKNIDGIIASKLPLTINL